MSEASPDRVRRAEERGSFPVSRRLTSAAALCATLATVTGVAQATRAAFEGALARAVTAASSDAPAAAPDPLLAAMSDALRACAPALGAATLALALAHALQTRFALAWPDEESGAARSLLGDAAWTLALTLTALVAAAHATLHAGLAARTASDVVGLFVAVGLGVARSVALVALALGVAEFFWMRARSIARLAPSRFEESEEMKEARGPAQTRDAMRRGET